jgi:hypothetical protein
MRRRLFLMIVALLLSMPVLADAVGPLDGAYVVADTSSSGQFVDCVVVIQNGDQIALMVLSADVSSWYYGRGTLTGTVASGLLFEPQDGTSFGTFRLSLPGDGSLSGDLVDGSQTVTLNGSKIF